MRIPENATLIATSYEQDQYGVHQKVETIKEVYGYYDSITASELFDGGRNGLNPQFRFVMTTLDYDGQPELIRGTERFSIYRTYRPGNGTVELYCERKGGTNGTTQTSCGY